VEVVASRSQGRTAAAQCGLFTHKSVPVIFEPPCIYSQSVCSKMKTSAPVNLCRSSSSELNPTPSSANEQTSNYDNTATCVQ